MNPAKFGHLSTGGKKTQVNLCYFKFFNTLFVYLYGGKPHLGGATAVLKIYSRKLARTLRIPGHRDDVVTKKASSILSKKFGGAVLVFAGIHYDKATTRQIQSIVKNSEKLSRKLISIL